MNKNRIFVVTTLFFLSCTAIKGMEERPGRYTLKTSDGIDISISQDFINKSETLKKLVEDISGNEPIPLPTIDSETLRKLIAISEDSRKLQELDKKNLINLANAADYLAMKELLDQIVEKLKPYYLSKTYLSTFARYGISKPSFNDLNSLIQSKLAQSIIQDVIKFLDVPHLYKEFEIKGLIIYSPDGKQLASDSDDGIVKIWNPQTGQLIRSLGHESYVNSVAYSPDGKQLASGSNDGTVKIWNAQTGQLIHTLEGHQGLVISVAYSPDGRQLASGLQDGTIKIWDPQTGQLIHTLEGHRDWVYSVAYSPDGKQLASGSRDGTVKIWDPQTGQLIHTLEGHQGNVNSVAYSPDGKQLASGSRDGTIKIWDPQTGQLIRSLEGHENHVKKLAYSPDGKQLASGSMDGTVKIWDPQTGQLIYALGNQEGVNSVDYSPDGEQLAVASAGIFIYHILPFAQREALRHITEIPQGLLLHIMQKNYEKSKKPLELNCSQSLFEIFNTLPENIRTYLQEAGWIEATNQPQMSWNQKIASTFAGLKQKVGSCFYRT